MLLHFFGVKNILWLKKEHRQAAYRSSINQDTKRLNKIYKYILISFLALFFSTWYLLSSEMFPILLICLINFIEICANLIATNHM